MVALGARLALGKGLEKKEEGERRRMTCLDKRLGEV